MGWGDGYKIDIYFWISMRLFKNIYLIKPNTYFTLDAPNPAVIALASEMKLTK